MPNNREVEFKLDVERADIDALVAAITAIGGPLDTHPVRSVYFDDAEQAVRRAGFTVRVRHLNGQRRQTVKAASDGAGLHDRAEWERDIDSDAPVLDGAGTPLAGHIGKRRLKRIAAQFCSAVDRSIVEIVDGAATIEVAVDDGAVIAGNRSSPLVELELELKRGSPSALFDLARRLDAAAPVRLGVLTKAERGYRLLDDDGHSPAKAEIVMLDPGATAATAFQAIARSCLRQFRLNEALLVASGEAATLHQARVGLRRLRSALTLFKTLFVDDPDFPRLRDGLRWIAAELGEVRNLDVLIARSDDAELRTRLDAGRKAAFDSVCEALASPRLRHLMLDLAEWLAIGCWLDAPAERRDQPAAALAVDRLDHFHRRVRKHGRHLAQLGDPARHAVRIEAKKLRYAAEFFATLFDGRRARHRRKPYLAALEALQARLGDLNDHATVPLVLEGLGIEALAANDAGDRAALLGRAAAAHSKLVAAKPFWR